MTRSLSRVALPIALAGGLLLGAPAALAASTDPGTVFTTFFGDLASGNTTALATLLAPTVTWQAGPAQAYPPNFPLSASGIQGVGTLLAAEQAAKVSLTLVGTPTVSGNTVTFTANLSDPVLTALGVASVKVDGTATVSNGQIASVQTTVDAASVAALTKAYGTAGAAAASAAAGSASTTATTTTTTTTLPKTGANPLVWLASLLLLGVGGLLARRTRHGVL